jgi:hypothetical protein
MVNNFFVQIYNKISANREKHKIKCKVFHFVKEVQPNRVFAVRRGLCLFYHQRRVSAENPINSPYPSSSSI